MSAIAATQYEYVLGETIGKIRFTISCGVAEYVEGETVDKIIGRVDEALYEAKKTGKNRVVAKKPSRLRGLFKGRRFAAEVGSGIKTSTRRQRRGAIFTLRSPRVFVVKNNSYQTSPPFLPFSSWLRQQYHVAIVRYGLQASAIPKDVFLSGSSRSPYKFWIAARIP